MLYLRPFNADDAKIFHRWYHDERLSAYFRGFVSGISLEQCRQASRFMKAHILVGCDSETHRPVGATTFADSDLVLRVYKMGMLIDPEHQHKSYGRHLTFQSVTWAFEKMNAHKIFIEMLTSDKRLVGGSEKAGFVFEGTKRQSCYHNGIIQDEHLYSMLRPEYESIKEITNV